MEHTFLASGTAEVSFNVGISGTSAQPTSVSLVLTRGATALSYTARPIDDKWVAIIESPGLSLGTGPASFSVNVVLNNRLFVLAKATAEIIDGSVTMPDSSPMQSMIDAASVSSTVDFSPVSPPAVQPILPESMKIPNKQPLNVDDIKEFFKVDEASIRTEFSDVNLEKNLSLTPPPIQLQLLKTIERQASPPKKVQPQVVEQVMKAKPVKKLTNNASFSIVKTTTVYR